MRVMSAHKPVRNTTTISMSLPGVRTLVHVLSVLRYVHMTPVYQTVDGSTARADLEGLGRSVDSRLIFADEIGLLETS